MRSSWMVAKHESCTRDLRFSLDSSWTPVPMVHHYLLPTQVSSTVTALAPVVLAWSFASIFNQNRVYKVGRSTLIKTKTASVTQASDLRQPTRMAITRSRIFRREPTTWPKCSNRVGAKPHPTLVIMRARFPAMQQFRELTSGTNSSESTTRTVLRRLPVIRRLQPLSVRSTDMMPSRSTRMATCSPLTSPSNRAAWPLPPRAASSFGNRLPIRWECTM